MTEEQLYRICNDIIPGLVELDEEDYQNIKNEALQSALKISKATKIMFDAIFGLTEEKRKEKIAS